MNHNLKTIFSIFIFLVFISICIGCQGSNPVVPEIDPNPPTNPENSTVSYIEVTAPSSTIKVNQSIQLVAKGYNSDDEWVILDKSKIKLWEWTVQGQCYNCVKPYVTLTPQSNSLTTTFISEVSGTFFIGAYYQENITDDYITDYIEIKVIK